MTFLEVLSGSGFCADWDKDVDGMECTRTGSTTLPTEHPGYQENRCVGESSRKQVTSCNPTMWSFKTCYSILIYCLKTAVRSSSAPGTKNGGKSTRTTEREGGKGSHNTVLSWCISIRVISFLTVLVVQYTATTSTWEAFFAFMTTTWDSVCLQSTGRHTESTTCSYLYGGMVGPGGLRVSLVFMVC